LSLVDNLTAEAVKLMKATGFSPAVVVETSPGNFQAWLKHPQQLTRELSTLAARRLAEDFGGDRGAADWRHFGRLSGLTNRKPKYLNERGLFPYVRLIEASGTQYPEGDRFVEAIATQHELDTRDREFSRPARLAAAGRHTSKNIDDFRSNPRYGGDATREDLAYATLKVVDALTGKRRRVRFCFTSIQTTEISFLPVSKLGAPARDREGLRLP